MNDSQRKINNQANDIDFHGLKDKTGNTRLSVFPAIRRMREVFAREKLSYLTLFILSAWLTACGGGTGNNENAPLSAEALFVPENAWPGDDIPQEAQALSSDDFLKRVDAGDLALVTRDSQQKQRERHVTQFESDRAFLDALSDRSEALDALLAEAKQAPDIYGQPVASLPDGRQVGLLDLATRLKMAVESYKLAHDVDNAIAVYALSYSLLSVDLKTQVSAPDTLRGKTLDQVREAAQQLNTLLGSVPNLDNTRPEEPPVATSMKSLVVAGNGTDEPSPSCPPPSGLYAQHWWPLKKFVSPIKDQGERGTCWAFAAIAAVESRERVRGNNPVNLSEQFLVNKVKREWEPSEFIDGGSAMSALNAAVDHNQSLKTEAVWTYNPARGRPDGANLPPLAGTAASYAGACNGYTGSCSKSAHQSPEFYTWIPGIGNFRAYDTVEPAGPSVVAGKVYQVWPITGLGFELETYRKLLADGRSLIGVLPIYEGFMAAAGGVVSNYDKKMKDAKGKLVDGSYSSHLVQVVGFLSNEQMRSPDNLNVNVGGGGYFIIRNSWGCAGDSGYYYVPADYVSGVFSALQVLEFDGTRSSQWQAEQVAPGSSTPFSLEPTSLTMKPDLRVPFDVSKAFKLADTDNPGIGWRLTISSDVDGLIYDGWWGQRSLFGNSINYTFNSLNYRTLTFTARYGSQVETTDAVFLVRNTPPQIALEGTGTPQVGQPFSVRAIVSDINEASDTALCSAMLWAVDAPDVIVSGEGCLRTLQFGAEGSRSVRVSTKDSEGAVAESVASFDVAPLPVNPYPRIASVSLNSREFKISGDFAFCVIRGANSSTTIDLTEKLCVPYAVPVPGETLPNRYFAGAAVENPAGEVLTYDWRLYVTTGISEVNLYSDIASSTPSFELTDYGNAQLVTNNCRVTLQVNAPDPARSKSQTVWTGRCTYHAGSVN